MNIKTMFSFRGTEHQPALYVGLAAILLGWSLVLFGYVNVWWIILSHIVTCFYLYCSSIGFHRLFSHKSYETYRPISMFLLLVGTLGAYGSSMHFTLSHIRHHLFSDTEDDPQQFETLKDVFLPSYVEKPATIAEKKMLFRRLGKYTEHRIAHNFYWLIIIAFVSILLILGGWKAALYLWALPAGMTVFTGRLFNLWAHDGMEQPTNVWWWGLPFGFSGEHLHKNHHDSPGSWDYREKPSDMDGGAYVVWAIMKNRPSWKSFISLDHKLEKRQI